REVWTTNLDSLRGQLPFIGPPRRGAVVQFQEHVRNGAHVPTARRLLEDVRDFLGLPYHLIVGRLGQVLDKPLLRELVQTNDRDLRQLQHPHGRLDGRSEEHTSELQSRENLVCRLLLET